MQKHGEKTWWSPSNVTKFFFLWKWKWVIMVVVNTSQHSAPQQNVTSAFNSSEVRRSYAVFDLLWKRKMKLLITFLNNMHAQNKEKEKKPIHKRMLALLATITTATCDGWCSFFSSKQQYKRFNKWICLYVAWSKSDICIYSINRLKVRSATLFIYDAVCTHFN